MPQIPHADSFIEKISSKKLVQDANYKFNQVYEDSHGSREVKVKFEVQRKIIPSFGDQFTLNRQFVVSGRASNGQLETTFPRPFNVSHKTIRMISFHYPQYLISKNLWIGIEGIDGEYLKLPLEHVPYIRARDILVAMEKALTIYWDNYWKMGSTGKLLRPHMAPPNNPSHPNSTTLVFANSGIKLIRHYWQIPESRNALQLLNSDHTLIFDESISVNPHEISLGIEDEGINMTVRCNFIRPTYKNGELERIMDVIPLRDNNYNNCYTSKHGVYHDFSVEELLSIKITLQDLEGRFINFDPDRNVTILFQII